MHHFKTLEPTHRHRTVYLHGLLNVSDLCDLLNVSRSTVYRWVRNEKLPPPYKIGRSIRWKTKEIEPWMEKINHE